MRKNSLTLVARALLRRWRGWGEDALVTGDAAAPSPAEMARFHEAAGRWGSGARMCAGGRAGATSRVRLSTSSGTADGSSPTTDN